MSDQSFLEQVAVNALGGISAAAFAGLLALGLAKKFSERRERRAELRARNEAAAEEFYRAYGSLFAAWKAWDDCRGRDPAPPTPPEDRAPFLGRVAEAEAMLESFLVRLTLERSLDDLERDRLWCFRRAYKVVRYSVRRDRRVPWKRSPGTDREAPQGYLQYKAFKRLAVEVATMIAKAPAVDDRPTVTEAADNLDYVTGPSKPLGQRYGLRRSAGVDHEDDLLWYEVAVRILPRRAASGAEGGETRGIEGLRHS